MTSSDKVQLITIHADAPAKPALGSPCNGCGVCCAAEPCPVSYVLLWLHQRPCKALQWNGQRYICGLVVQSGQYLPCLPRWTYPLAVKLVKRWIAADQHCDADVEWQGFD